MKVHISLNVSDVEESISFYSRMFQAEPLKHIKAQDSGNPGYAKFDIADPPLNLVLNERNVDRGSGLSHLGLQVESTDKVVEYRDRWKEAGLITADELDVVCCYARQDKTWIQDPDGNEWEAFVVLEDVVSMDPAEAVCCDTSQPFSVTSIGGLKNNQETAETAGACSPDVSGSSCC
jgi:catechol 2,3-dioxygenase-like lactoylglutathione lyase family enzyme